MEIASSPHRKTNKITDEWTTCNNTSFNPFHFSALPISIASAMRRASPSSGTLAFLFFISALLSTEISASQSSLRKKSSLSVEDDSDILVSRNKSFTCGFYKVGTNAYVFAIWFTASADKTTAWVANRDRPVNGIGSRIVFRSDGSVVLMDVDDSVAWSTNTSSTQADKMQLLDTGNLIINDPNGNILWQSFDSPTDTLLPAQPITKTVNLVSSITRGSVASGYYNFIFDNNNILTLIYNGPEISSIYWPDPDFTVYADGRTNYNSSRYGVLDEEGQFQASDRLALNASDLGPGIMRRLTLDYDGNVRLYSLDESTGMWFVSWEALPKRCQVHGLCGKNGVCVYIQSGTKCSCLPGYEMIDPTDWSQGCMPKYNVSCKNKPETLEFVEIPQTDFWGYDINYTAPISLSDCKDLCRNDCSCQAINYKTGSGDCYTKSVLFNGRSSLANQNSIYLKVPRSVAIPRGSSAEMQERNCSFSKVEDDTKGSSEQYGRNDTGRTKWAYFYWFLGAFGMIEFTLIAFGWWFIFKREKRPTELEEGYRMISNQFRRFTYKELKKATDNFKEELGRGGAGAVYKGVLDDERVVAIKKLEDISQGEEEFWGEVSVIGKIYHMNLVRMWGFCSEGSHKLLVYEYVENGSLDKHLFNCDRIIPWNVRFKIFVGVAKALAYLHHECLEWIIHCDVKPENILLGSNFEPKVADFGLAKLAKRGGTGSNISRIRGTRGYMAPEWTSNLPITAKVDVYSFGVVLLEVVMGRRAAEWRMDGNDEADRESMSLVRTLKIRLEKGEDSWVGDFVDGRLEGDFNCRQAKVMLEMAIHCLEEERSKRPSMDSVVQMLQSCDS